MPKKHTAPSRTAYYTGLRILVGEGLALDFGSLSTVFAHSWFPFYLTDR